MKAIVNIRVSVHDDVHGKKTVPPDLSTLPHAQNDNLILMVLERLGALESKVNKDNHNSSKPPSSDGLTRKTRSLREPSGKKAGGQTGHKGTTFWQIKRPTQIVPHRLPSPCDRCRQALPHGDAIVAERRHVFEVPMTPCEVIEHRTLTLRCRCGQAHTSTFPADVTEDFCIIRSCLGTLRKQGHGMLDVLRQAFTGIPIQPAHRG